MNFRAAATFQAGDFSRLENLIVPRLVTGATAATKAVFDISQTLVHVRSGELKGSGSYQVEWVGQKVIGYVTYSSPHAAYNEFGTGRRGAASGQWAGPYPYKLSWPGMTAIPFIRPAMDIGRQQILDAFQEALAG